MWRHAWIGSKLALFCLIGGVAIACVQTYETDLRGKPPESDQSSASEVIVAHLERGQLQARLKKLKIEFESSSPVTDYKERNDYSVVLMSLGETEKAIEILKSIESERPNEYNTAANLGTAFELHGDLASALHWIKIGIERNRQAHSGTEWLHARILEAELQLASDPTWLTSHSVLGVAFGNEAQPAPPGRTVIGNTGFEVTLPEIETALRFQLKERIGFVPPPNAVVADLLGDLGNVMVLNKLIRAAIPIYKLALEYQPARPLLIQQRLEHARRLAADDVSSEYAYRDLRNPALRSTLKAGAIGAVAVCGGIVIGRYLSRRRIRQVETRT